MAGEVAYFAGVMDFGMVMILSADGVEGEGS